MNRSIEWWDRYFLGMAEYVAKASKDPSTKVGAVLVDQQRVVVGTGYNGFARGVSDDDARYNEREVKYKFIVHAEVNAIVTAGHRARGSTLYVWPPFTFPAVCCECAKVAIQAGVTCIVGYVAPSDERAAR